MKFRLGRLDQEVRTAFSVFKNILADADIVVYLMPRP